MRDRRRYPSLPLVGAGAVVHKRRRVLLLKRRFPPNAGLWAIPGGLVELGETAKAAAAREVKEETGLEVKIERLIDVGTDLHYDRDGRVEYHFVLVDYLARVVGGTFRMNEESSDGGWFTEGESLALEMSEGTRNVVSDYFGIAARAKLSARR